MTTSHLPGMGTPIEPEFTHFDPVPKIARKKIHGLALDLFILLIELSRKGRDVRATNAELAAAVGCDRATVVRSLRFLRTTPSTRKDRPSIEVQGGRWDRKIRVVCRPKVVFSAKNRGARMRLYPCV